LHSLRDVRLRRTAFYSNTLAIFAHSTSGLKQGNAEQPKRCAGMDGCGFITLRFGQIELKPDGVLQLIALRLVTHFHEASYGEIPALVHSICAVLAAGSARARLIPDCMAASAALQNRWDCGGRGLRIALVDCDAPGPHFA
jgi:hypothetical protein